MPIGVHKMHLYQTLWFLFLCLSLGLCLPFILTCWGHFTGCQNARKLQRLVRRKQRFTLPMNALNFFWNWNKSYPFLMSNIFSCQILQLSIMTIMHVFNGLRKQLLKGFDTFRCARIAFVKMWSLSLYQFVILMVN
jgi:hypothetical protein